MLDSNFINDPDLFASVSKATLYILCLRNGASCLPWFVSLRFPFHAVLSAVCARPCENTLTFFSGFEAFFNVLNLIFSSFISIKVVGGFSYFSFYFSSPAAAFVDMLSRWSPRCDVLCMPSLVGLGWEEQQRDGELWEVTCPEECPLMTTLIDRNGWSGGAGGGGIQKRTFVFFHPGAWMKSNLSVCYNDG